MTNLPLLIHIGYHKTATTWLQAQFFRDYHGFRKIMDHSEIFSLITEPHGLVFEPDETRQVIKERILETPANFVPVISSEILSGNPFFGGRESDVFAERLFRIWPEARILITIRSQMKVLPSVYMQYLQRGGTLPYPKFFRENSDLGYTWFSPVHFEYDRLLRKYQLLYGNNSVFVMQQEALLRDPQETCRKLANFAKAELYDGLTEGAMKPRGASYPEYSAWALRRVNHFQKSVLNRHPVVKLGENPDGLYRITGYLAKRRFIERLVSHRRPISEWVKKEFSGRFHESNARLEAIAEQDMDLSAYS